MVRQPAGVLVSLSPRVAESLHYSQCLSLVERVVPECGRVRLCAMISRLLVVLCLVSAAVGLPASSNAQSAAGQGKDRSTWDVELGKGKKQ